MNKILILASAIFLILGLSLFSPLKVSAGGSTYIPPECPNNYEPDFTCINRKILNPADPCKENKCKGSDGEKVDPILEKYNEYGILGVKVRVTEDSIPSLINLAISTFLGIIALYALFRGIYVAGVKRTQATTDEDLANVNKELTAIVIGFVVAFSFIFIIQVIFNLLGLGGVTDLNVNFTGEIDEDAPQIIISGRGN